jgi:hypothetical protein
MVGVVMTSECIFCWLSGDLFSDDHFDMCRYSIDGFRDLIFEFTTTYAIGAYHH